MSEPTGINSASQHELSEKHQESSPFQDYRPGFPDGGKDGALTDLHKDFYYVAADGDLVVSFSEFPQDCLFVSSQALARKSPWFKAALSSHWAEHGSHDALCQTPGRKVRYELAYNDNPEDARSWLEPKYRPTPTDERRSVTAAALWEDPVYISYKADDSQLQADVRSWPRRIRASPYSIFMTTEEAVTIMIYKLGFSMLLGMPLRLSASYESTNLPAYKTLIVLELLTWMDYYSVLDNKENVDLLSNYIVEPENYSEVERFPSTYLRIAHLMRSEAVYMVALQCMLHHGIYDWPPLDQQVDGNIHIILDIMNVQRSYDRELHRISSLISRIQPEQPHPRATTNMATDIFRSWFNLQVSYHGQQDVLMRLAQGECDYQEVFARWKRRVLHDKDDALPCFINPRLLKSSLRALFSDALKIIKGCCVDEKPIRQGSRLLQLEVVDPGSVPSSGFPWRTKPRMNHTFESHLTTMLKHASRVLEQEHEQEQEENNDIGDWGHDVAEDDGLVEW